MGSSFEEQLPEFLTKLYHLHRELLSRYHKLEPKQVSEFFGIVLDFVKKVLDKRADLSSNTDPAKQKKQLADLLNFCGSILRVMDVNVAVLINSLESPTCNLKNVSADTKKRINDERSRIKNTELPVYKRELVPIIGEYVQTVRKQKKDNQQAYLAVLHFVEKFLNEIK